LGIGRICCSVSWRTLSGARIRCPYSPANWRVAAGGHCIVLHEAVWNGEIAQQKNKRRGREGCEGHSVKVMPLIHRRRQNVTRGAPMLWLVPARRRRAPGALVGCSGPLAHCSAPAAPAARLLWASGACPGPLARCSGRLSRSLASHPLAVTCCTPTNQPSPRQAAEYSVPRRDDACVFRPGSDHGRNGEEKTRLRRLRPRTFPNLPTLCISTKVIRFSPDFASSPKAIDPSQCVRPQTILLPTPTATPTAPTAMPMVRIAVCIRLCVIAHSRASA